MKASTPVILSLVLLGSLALSGAILAQDKDAPRPAERPVDAGKLRAFIELARSDIRTEKTLIIAQNIQFTEDEATGFWAFHSDYNNELNKLLDQRLELLDHYAATYKDMTDKQAADLAGKAFNWEEKRTKLKRIWFKKFCKVIPAKKAAQFFQIENQLNAVLDLRLAASLPLIK